jgi:hypothetical protein
MAQAIGATTFSHFCTAANYSSLCPGSGATLQVNSVNNSSQALLNDETSTTNATGLTVTPSNPSGGIVKHEITGTVNLGNMAQLFVDNPQTSTYNAVTADLLGCKTITIASGTFTIGLLATVPASGQCLQVINYGTGTITVSPNGHNLNGSSSSATIPPGSASAATGGYFHSDGTNYEGVWSGTNSGVTAVSIVSANGVSGTSSGGTTPALTIALGAITPTTVVASTSVTSPSVIATTSSSVNTGSANNGFITTAKIAQNNTSVLGWENSATDATGSLDTGLSRDAAGVVDVGNGTAGNTSGTLQLGQLNVGVTTSGVPVAGTCGGGTVHSGSNNNAFSVTGITATTSCTVTFSKNLSQGLCVANALSGGVPIAISAATLGSSYVIFTTAAAMTGSITAICF